MVSLPKGGGAIRGIGEKFAANPVTGSSTFSIPLPASPGRGGFGPQLSLSYDSGSGNGPFGFGWSLALPAITRKTDKGLPRYGDDTDTFLIAGAEDLVPVLNATGEIEDDDQSVAAFVIRRYQPRIEGVFARIQRWTRKSDGDTHWRSISADNILSIYGKDDGCRIFDPADRSHVFSWLLCETRDDKGNAVVYDYQAEVGTDVDLSQAHEQQRGAANDSSRTSNRYINRIRYGNAATLLDSGTSRRPPFLSQQAIDETRWMFELAFDYGEPDPEHPSVVGPWTRRIDPFSTYRAGFEVRTYRLCRRVLMFHDFPEFDVLPADPAVGPRRLVRSLDLSYRTAPVHAASSDAGYNFLHAATLWSYQRDAGAWHRRPLPPLEFRYSEAKIGDQVQEVSTEALENLPVGIGSGYRWIDLDGEGLSGILTEQAGTWYYKPNLGDGPSGPGFGPAQPVASRPSTAALNSGRQQLMDVQGNGALDLVDFHAPVAGFQERDEHEGWKPFIPFASLPNIDWDDRNLRFVDLTGDGHADALITEHEVFTWYPSQAEKGFGAAERTATALDERDGPRIVLADGEQAVYRADLSGDGLSDLVRIRNGQVCYWPNLGYGRFGKQIVMDGSPWFDHPDQFDQRRIRLADIDGSGTTDLIYLGRDGARLWFNRSGNSWSAARQLPFPVATSNFGQIQVADLLGNGTACLIWSSDLPGDGRRPCRYLDLMSGNKPHLMIEMRNNLGVVTTVDYAASTRFYLRDKAADTPWVTRLPFPVHCVEKVTVTDLWRNTTFASTYSYHHGYFDGVEREFRGFGRVEQVDTQAFREVAAANLTSAFLTPDQTLYQPPVKTTTWFHTGIATDRSRILGLYEREYFPSRYAERLESSGFAEDELPQPAIEDTVPELAADEWREAMRACKGTTLRQEVVELDVKALQERGAHKPVRLFSAAQHNCHIRRVQHRGRNRHAVFLVTESEAITYHYELAIDGAHALDPDPRIAHALNLRFDDFGRAVQSVVAAYPRRKQHSDPALNAQQVALIRAVQNDERHLTYTETRFTDKLPADVHTHRLPAPCEVRTFELTGIDLPAGRRYFLLDALRSYGLDPVLDTQADKAVGSLGYHQQPPDKRPHKRLVEHALTLYFKDDLTGPLAPGTPSRLGLTYEMYKLALTASLLDDVFTSAAGHDAFNTEARAALDSVGARPSFLASGYQTGSAIFGAAATPAFSWWLRSGVAGFAAAAARHFYLPERYIDPFGHETTLEFDIDDLFVRSSTDALGNVTAVELFDHRVLATARMKDANDNVSEAAYDIRGLPVATALMGKMTSGVAETGDTVAALTFGEINPSPSTVAQFFETTPLNESQARAWLGKATARFTYHFGESHATGVVRWARTATGACGILRERHERDLPNTPANRIPLQIGFEYSDGAGQPFVTKAQAEPDPAIANGPVRWIANGKTIVNNKGKPVLQYEPYFSSSGHRFEEPVAEGVTAAMFYDAPGRLILTEFPDGTLSRVEFSPWFTRSFDQNDTVLESHWYRVQLTEIERAPDAVPATSAEEADAQRASPNDKTAARLAALHANTPAEVHFDSLGRDVVAIAHNRAPSIESVLPDAQLVDRPWLNTRLLTFTKLDAEGKPLWICDARGNLVMQYISPPQPNHTPLYDVVAPDHKPVCELPANAVPCYDIAGNLLFQHSMDSGDRRMLMDAAGQPMLGWDYNERIDTATAAVYKEHRRFETRYDELHRPAERRLRVRDEDSGVVAEFLIERFRYGEGQPGDKGHNLRGQVWQHYDGSGVGQTDSIDLSGKPLCVRRRLAGETVTAVVDWTGRQLDDVHVPAAPGFDAEVFTQRTDYDALGRMTRHYNWHVESPSHSDRSERVAVYLPRYNRRGALEEETLLVRARKIAGGHEVVSGTTRTQRGIKHITYNAKGQKLTLELGNDTVTRYTYDPDTFRLVHLYTSRDAGVFANDCGSGTRNDARPLRPCGVQNLHYHYDPIGNITHIQDDAQQTIWFANQQVEPSNDYVYDALYRLIEGTGRENAAAAGAPPHPEGPWPGGAFPSPGSTATRSYTQRYRYDAVGNIGEMRHLTPSSSPTEPPGWTRKYRYAQDSNRLLETWYGRTPDPQLGSGRVAYRYDTHGGMLNLNASPSQFDLRWDWNDMIRSIDLGGGGRAWYQYGADKQRCRKRLVRNPAVNGTIQEDRIYLGGYERYRRYTGDPNDPVEEIESHHLVEGDQRVLLVDDVLKARNPRPDGVPVRTQTLWRYQYANHLVSVGLELDDQARVISYEEFHPYGTTAYRATSVAVEAPAKRYRYTGMERDEESGLNYHGVRHCAVWLGRWVAPDPRFLVDGANIYAFVSGNPLRLIDRTGSAGVTPPPGPIIGDFPRLYQAWLKATDEVLQSLKGFDYLKELKGVPDAHRMEANIKRFEKYIEKVEATFGKGSNRKVGTARNVARRTYSSVRTAFGVLVEQMGGSLKGIQLHHGGGGIFEQPGKALDAGELMLQEGQAAVKGTGHNLMHYMEKLGGKNPGPKAIQELGEEISKNVNKVGNVVEKTMAAVLRRGSAIAQPVSEFVGKAGKVAGTVAEGIKPAAGVIASGAKSVGGILAKGAKVLPVVAALFVAKDAHAAVTTQDTSERVQKGADFAAGGAGFLGPVGMAGSLGYAAGGLINTFALSADTQNAIGGALDEVINQSGWKEIVRHPFGVGL
ncbi:MAG TPA: SpvB/TcaC N-terminal domain-containing protein [Vicinamibacterales bacterium]|nr:SpvB/TcaC N-terminal domain-containing protein [Vicinamibacterales bacterium]